MNAVDLVIEGKPKDLGSFTVRRALPHMRRRLVGPFIFFDHMGPAELRPGEGIDVRPHPHIALATVTYLFEGEILHRDSVGSQQAIVPGDVNWMIAGRGIVHSERTRDALRASGMKLHGIQSWVALPLAHEETVPSFVHHPARTLPVVERDGATLRVIAGSAYGATSPVDVLSPTLYVDAQLAAGADLALSDEHAERAAYIVEGRVTCGETTYEAGTMIILTEGAAARLGADAPARVMLLGGAKLDGERHIEWNFVASTKDRIEQAKRDWRDGRFPKVPGDDVEFIPLPPR